MTTARPIRWDLYEEHLDEAAFLWGQWEQAMDAVNYALDDVIAGPEERLLAHLDGLVLGGARIAQRFLIPALGSEDFGKVTAAAWGLLQAEDADHLEVVFDALTKADTKETRAALGRAFCLSHRNDLPARMLPLLDKSAPAVQAIIVNVVSARAQPGTSARSAAATQPELPLGELLGARHPELQVAALRALRRTPDPAYARFVEGPLGSPYLAVRDTAIETGMILGMRTAWQACSKLVARKAMGCRLPLALLSLGGEPVDVKSVIKRLDVEAMRRDALWALGFAGTVEAAEAALALIGDEQAGAVAGESFATMTGMPLTGALIKIGETDNAAPPPVDEDDDAPLPVVTPEGDLPTPNAERVRGWWDRAKAKFEPGVRYLHGLPVAADGLKSAIFSGPTWRRRVHCLEVAMRGGFDLDVGAWAQTQKKAAGGWPGGLRMDRELTGPAGAAR